MEPRDPLDDLVSSARRARLDSADAIDELIGGRDARRADDEPVAARSDLRRSWSRALAFSLGALALSGVLADVVAASQLLSSSGPDSLAIVWPIGGIFLLAVALLETKYVDRFARLDVLRVLCAVYGAAFLVTVVLFALNAPPSIPAALAWLLADQMNFLFPLVVWSLAGDIFTAGQGVTVFPMMSRWLYIGQIAGLSIATVVPLVFDLDRVSLSLLLAVPVVACIAVVVVVPRALRDATASGGHGRKVTAFGALKDTAALVRELPAFRWLLRASFAGMFAGAMLEFSFFDIVWSRFDEASDLQIVYASTSLAGFFLCWMVQRFAATPLLNRLGVGRVLGFVPLATVAAGVLLTVAGVHGMAPLAIAGLLVWRIPRWSIDGSARQAAMATIPDERRAAASFLIDLAPFALGLVVVAVPILLQRLTGRSFVVPAIALAAGVVAVVLVRHVASTWDDTQLSYRLKRRRRLG